jgi:hypothetical protein
MVHTSTATFEWYARGPDLAADYSYFLPDGAECRDEEAHRFLVNRLVPVERVARR